MEKKIAFKCLQAFGNSFQRNLRVLSYTDATCLERFLKGGEGKGVELRANLQRPLADLK